MNSQLLKELSNKKTNFDFGDKRINCRAEYIVNKMSKNSGKSMPQTFFNPKDLRGAYRFFSNSKVTPKNILLPHREETIQRCRSQKAVCVVNDSSDVSFDFMQCLEGFNSLHSNLEKGYRIHPCLAITEEGTPLGVLASFNYTRKEKESKEHRNSLPIEKKESYRWLQGYREACKLKAELSDTQVICLADSESDIYECLLEATTKKGPRADIVFRAQHNRKLVGEDEDTNKIKKKLIRTPELAVAKILLNKYQPTERIAEVAIRASAITLCAPETSKKKSLKPITINAVFVTEIDPPNDTTTIEWLLLTTLPIETKEDVERIIKIYSTRWSIEIYFKVLKSGCRIDAIQFQDVSRIKRYIALMMLVAWKVMLTTYLPREYPEAPYSILFTNIEWRLAYRRIYKDKPFPKEEPSLQEVVMLVAMLGGYQKRREPPGIQTIWEGVKRLLDMSYGHELAQEIVLEAK